VTSLRRPPDAARALAASLLLCATGCGVFGAPERPTEEDVALLPPDVVATLLSAAVRAELGATAQPSPATPVRVTPTGFAVTFELGPQSRWLPRADQLFLIRSDAASNGALVERRELRGEAAGFGLQREAVLEIHVTPRGAGASVRETSSRTYAPTARAVIARTLRLLHQPDRGGPGSNEPNFLAWRLGDLLARARQSPREDLRGALLRAAARLPLAPASVYEQLSELLLAAGDRPRALAHLRRAALATRDPAGRAALARAADALRSRPPQDARGDALTELVAGDLAGAELLLHTARRRAPSPSVDYELLGALHRARGQETPALAAELLAREYAQADLTIEAAPLAEPRGRAVDLTVGWSPRMVLKERGTRATRGLYGAGRANR
jgi:hypothetical protein